MTRGSRFRSIVLLAAAVFAFTSCWRINEASIKPPPNPVLSRGLGWGVVKDAYVRLKEQPSASARDLDHLRRGGIFELDARVLESSGPPAASPIIWYNLSSEGLNGWVRDSELEVYSSQAQAEKAAEAYR